MGELGRWRIVGGRASAAMRESVQVVQVDLQTWTLNYPLKSMLLPKCPGYPGCFEYCYRRPRSLSRIGGHSNLRVEIDLDTWTPGRILLGMVASDHHADDDPGIGPALSIVRSP